MLRDSDAVPLETVEGIASSYLEDIRSVQPKGPTYCSLSDLLLVRQGQSNHQRFLCSLRWGAIS